MPTVTIVKPFTFTHSFVRDPQANDGSPHPAMSTTDDPGMHAKDEFIPIGVHNLPDAMANHWYVQAHTDKPPMVMPRPGTPEYAGHQIAAARRRQMVEAAIEQEAQEAAAKIRQDAMLSGRIAENEEQAQAESREQDEVAAQATAENEAARTGRRVASPGGGRAERRSVLPPRNAPPPAQQQAPVEQEAATTTSTEAAAPGAPPPPPPTPAV